MPNEPMPPWVDSLVPSTINHLPVTLAIPLRADPSMLPDRHIVLCHRESTHDSWIVWEVGWHVQLNAWVAEHGDYLSNLRTATLRTVERAGSRHPRTLAHVRAIGLAATILLSFSLGMDEGVLALLDLGVDPALVAAASAQANEHLSVLLNENRAHANEKGDAE
ncbi:MAG TPA: hypothetical protein VFW65_32040 [Pseudonocardiaceae bacterium]|nr:hypothetical protein [Pseudonocardiaceae bacterium]